MELLSEKKTMTCKYKFHITMYSVRSNQNLCTTVVLSLGTVVGSTGFVLGGGVAVVGTIGGCGASPINCNDYSLELYWL